MTSIKAVQSYVLLDEFGIEQSSSEGWVNPPITIISSFGRRSNEESDYWGTFPVPSPKRSMLGLQMALPPRLRGEGTLSGRYTIMYSLPLLLGGIFAASSVYRSTTHSKQTLEGEMIRTRTLGAMLSFLLFGLTAVSAQPVPSDINGALAQRFSVPTITPPLNSSMPFDVLIGYIIGDSIARNLNIAQRDSLFRNLTYSDTLKYALKYLYKMVDYDPISFFQWGSYRPIPTMYPSAPGVLHHALLERTRKIYPDKQRTAMLSTADVIAHIKVNSTQHKIDTTAVHAKNAVAVTATVIEPIKGQRIPNCWVDSRAKGEKERSLASVLISTEGDKPAVPGACLQFEYRLEWPRLNKSMLRTNLDSTLVDANGKQWVQPDMEYIVFLRFAGLGRTANYNYAVLIPVAWFGTTCSIYPIIDGKVYDHYDDFGFGSGLTPEQFKSALGNKIHSIINP